MNKSLISLVRTLAVVRLLHDLSARLVRRGPADSAPPRPALFGCYVKSGD